MQFVTNRRFAKPLLAAAVTAAFAAPASAQSNVNVEGVIDTFVGSMRNAGDTSSTSVLGSSGMTTSYFGFRGEEDLGGGLKAQFALTGYIRPDTGSSGAFDGDTLFSRDANVGLSGGFGSIALGRALAPYTLPVILSNPFGNSFKLSPLALHVTVPLFNATGWSNSVGGDTGWSNEIQYTTPNFGGLTANLHYQLGEKAGDSSKNNIGGNLLYANGPLSLNAFYHRLRVNNPLDTTPGVVQTYAGLSASEQKAWMVGGAYDFSVVKLFATYGGTSHDVDLKDKTTSLGASVPVGSGNFLLAWAQTKRSGTGFADTKRSTASVGYDYNLSKRTDLYAVYMNDKITGFDSGNSVAAGIRHRF